jgi:ABC-type nitrate/sulfonate/bicarbonate transport system substrate-binding protein
MKKILFGTLCVVAGLGFLAGCSRSKNDASKPLRVATMPATMGAPVAYALENGYFAEEGLEIELIMFPTGTPINEAFAAGQLDVCASGLASVYSLANGNAKWIGEVNTTRGNDIYVRADSPILKEKGKVPGYPEIYGSAGTVRNMKVLLPLGTSAQFAAIGYAARFGLTSADFQPIHMEYGPAYQAFLTGEGDVIATTPPYSLQAANDGFVRAASFEDATGVFLTDGIFAESRIVETRRADVIKFLKAVYRAMDDMSTNPTVRAQFSKDWFTVNGRAYDDKTMADEIVLRDYITKSYMQKADYVFGTGMTQIAMFFVNDGKIQKENFPNVQKSYDPSLLEEALGISIKADK